MAKTKKTNGLPAIKPEIPPIAETLPLELSKAMDSILVEFAKAHRAHDIHDTKKVPPEVVMRWYVEVAARFSLFAIRFAKRSYDQRSEYCPLDDRATAITRSIVHQVMQHVEERAQAIADTITFPEDLELSYQEWIEEIKAGRGVWRGDEEEGGPKTSGHA